MRDFILFPAESQLWNIASTAAQELLAEGVHGWTDGRSAEAVVLKVLCPWQPQCHLGIGDKGKFSGSTPD